MKTICYVNRRSGACRSGLSILEFLGCLIAVAGGMWFGAAYLGLDVEKIAYETVRDSGFMESLPDDIKPQPPEDHLDRMTKEQLTNRLQGELSALRHEITALRKSTHSSLSQKTEATNDSGKFSVEKTLAYWEHLIDIAVDEAALQIGAQSALTDANTDNVFSLRGRVSRFAAKAVESSPSSDVDPAAQHFGSQLADWYVRSGNLYDRAAHLWSDQNAQQSSAQLTKRWETAERQLRNEAELLSNKANSTQATLSRTYRIEFPAFGG